jgi:pimeloyl-ACP methyl ester carboxylesterase
VRGLRNRYRTPGIGAALAASLEPLESTAGKLSSRIPPRLKIPVTAFLRLDDPRAALASGKLHGKLEFYTQDSTRTLKIEGVDVPIEYETTSALALTLEGAPVWDFEIAGFRSGDFTIGDANLREGVFMLQPHKTGRMPVVLVHGTASSPARWAELINELENDPRFWEKYEIWLFMYNTGNPIAYSAMLLRDGLTKIVKELDPEDKDKGLKQMVVMGHSQGGLLTKMTVIDSGTRLWPFSVPPEELDIEAETRELLTNALMIKPLPFVRRVVFIATPHRGSYQALGVLGNLASWLVNLPGRFTKLSLDLLRGPAGRGRRRRRQIFERAYRRRRIGEDCALGTFDAGKSRNDSGSEAHPGRARRHITLIHGALHTVASENDRRSTPHPQRTFESQR